MKVSFEISSPVTNSIRVKQLSSIFDVPLTEKLSRKWDINFDIERKPWAVGLIVGPSGSGKSKIARHVWGDESVDGRMKWNAASVIDDFDKRFSIDEISKVCGAVGFNTIPSWMRPFHTLSNGEMFRVELARKLLESQDNEPIIVDEFSSVVDRQVAQIASHAVQKYVRRNHKQFVAVTCHYDVIDWLQPDWVLEPSTCEFRWRLLQRRPTIECEIKHVHYSAWKKFAPYHYMSADLNKSARCYGLFVNDNIIGFAGVLHTPVSRSKNAKKIWRLSRIVILPDWQGCGFVFPFMNALGSAYKTCGHRFRATPAHPVLVDAFEKKSEWKRIKRAGVFSGYTSNIGSGFGGRPCGVYEYDGPAASDKWFAMNVCRLIK